MLINEFLDHYRKMEKSENTIINYEVDLKQFYELMSLNDNDITELDASDAIEYIEILKGGNLTPRTINRKLSTISAFYSFLYLKGNVEDNIFKKVGKLSVEVEEPKYLEIDEAEELLSLAREKVQRASIIKKWLKVRDLLIIEIFLACGLRAFELENLELDDIELEGKHRGRITVRKGKGNKRRTVYMPEAVIATYEVWLKERELKNIDCEKIFISLNKKALCKRQIQNIVTDLVDELGLDVSTHGLRHTFATTCVSNNVDLRAVSKALGHSSTAITEKVYIHATEKDLKDCRDNNPLF